MTNGFTIIVDTREQTPWAFSEPTIRATLKTGDYSAQGLEDVVAIERKSLPDLVSSLTWGRQRFMREVERLKTFERRAIIVEGTFDDLTSKDYRGNATPQSLVASVLAIAVDHGVPVIFAGNPRKAAWCALWLLRRAWTKRSDGEVAA